MIVCKHGNEGAIVKNGIVRGKRRHQCKDCGCNFVGGDGRKKPNAAIRRTFAVVLSVLGKGPYGFMAKLSGVTPAALLKWARQEAASLPGPGVSGAIREMGFDGMWHFIGPKKTSVGLSRRWAVPQGGLSPGSPAIVMPQPSEGPTTRWGT